MGRSDLRLESAVETIRPRLEGWFSDADLGSDDDRHEFFVFDKQGRRPFVVLCTLMGGTSAIRCPDGFH